MGYQPTRSTPNSNPRTPVYRRSLLVCDYCGMSYDGEKHVNCPHCNAPRPDVKEEKPKDLVSRLEELERQTEEHTTFCADNVLYVTYDQLGQVVGPSPDEERPATPEASEDERLDKLDVAVIVSFCIVLILLPAAIIIAAISP